MTKETIKSEFEKLKKRFWEEFDKPENEEHSKFLEKAVDQIQERVEGIVRQFLFKRGFIEEEVESLLGERACSSEVERLPCKEKAGGSSPPKSLIGEKRI